MERAELGSGAQTPQSILREFDRLRRDVLEILDEAEGVAGVLPFVGDAIKLGKSLEAARATVSETRLSLVVLGAEGAGKSTLIRGLLGQELSPIEDNTAGTVAPVFLAYSDQDEPEFWVEFLTSGTPDKKCSREEYYAFIQQRDNPKNVKKVRRAIVKVRNPLLESGLVLVDMPGVGGVDDVIREEANAFIRTRASSVIGMAMGRTFGDLVDIAKNFSSTPEQQLRFHAIISNRPVDFFQNEDDEVHDDATLDANIKSARQMSHAKLKEAFEGGGITRIPSVEQMFVFSANTLYRRSGRIATPAHLAEIRRFDDRLAHYVRENGLSAAIRGAVRHGGGVVANFMGLIDVRRKLLRQVLSGDRGLLAIFQKAAAEALKTHWVGSAISKERLDALSHRLWLEFRDELASGRASSLTTVDDLIEKLEAADDKLSSATIRDWIGATRMKAGERLHHLNEKFTALVRQGASEILADANRTLDAALEPLPFLFDAGLGGGKLTQQDVFDQSIGDVSVGGGRTQMKAIGGAAGAAAGLGVASAGQSLLLVPDPTLITQTLGLLIGGVAAWSAIDMTLTRVFGSERQVALKELRQMRSGLLDEATANHVALENEFNKSVTLQAEQTDKSLQARLKQIEALLLDPGEERSRIERELAGLDQAHEALGALETRLGAIRKAVRQTESGADAPVARV